MATNDLEAHINTLKVSHFDNDLDWVIDESLQDLFHHTIPQKHNISSVGVGDSISFRFSSIVISLIEPLRIRDGDDQFASKRVRMAQRLCEVPNSAHSFHLLKSIRAWLDRIEPTW